MCTLSVKNICEKLVNAEQKILKPNTLGKKICFLINWKIVNVKGWQ